jgi:hypothetical protein
MMLPSIVTVTPVAIAKLAPSEKSIDMLAGIVVVALTA